MLTIEASTKSRNATAHSSARIALPCLVLRAEVRSSVAVMPSSGNLAVL